MKREIFLWVLFSLLTWSGAAGLFLIFCHWWVHRAGKGRIFGSVDSLPENETGLVLGTAKRLVDGRLNRFFLYRMDAAAHLYRVGKVRFLLLSGSIGRGRYSETEEMKRELMARGVPAEALILDYAGVRTLRSIIRARRTFGLVRLTVVSQEFHNRRALYYCRYFGIEAVGFNARAVRLTEAPRVFVREVLARVAAVLEMIILR